MAFNSIILLLATRPKLARRPLAWGVAVQLGKHRYCSTPHVSGPYQRANGAQLVLGLVGKVRSTDGARLRHQVTPQTAAVAVTPSLTVCAGVNSRFPAR
jgi:hypothetical protein